MDPHSFLPLLYETAEIPLCIVDKSENMMTLPAYDEPILPFKFVLYCIESFERQMRDELHPLVLLTEPAYFIGVAKLDNGEFLIMGPASPFPHSQKQAMTLAANVLYPDKLKAFCEMLASAPTVAYRKFINTLSLAVLALTGEKVSKEDIILCNNSTKHREAEPEMMEKLFNQRENAAGHTPQSFENGVLSAIESGDAVLLKRRMNEPLSGHVGQMSVDIIKQERYTFIAFATLVTRAAIKGGLNPETACTLSDIYCKRMDALTRVQDINSLSFQMAVDFCGKVAEFKNAAGYSKLVRSVCEYISLHLHEEIGLYELSESCGLCQRSISKRFHEEMGMKIPDYIHRQKMKEAVYLLDYSKYGIAEISEFLSYSSQSYFTKIFREIYGITPQQHRDRKK